MIKTAIWVLVAFSAGHGNYGTATKIDEFSSRESCRAFVDDLKQVRFARSFTNYICVEKRND